MRKTIFVVLFIFCNFLFCGESNIGSDCQLAATTSEPSANVENAVNVITGDYFISETYFLVQGYEPIVIHPVYISKNSRGGWSLLNHLIIEVHPDIAKIFVTDSKGAILEYDCSHFRQKRIKNDDSKNDENRRRFNEDFFDYSKLVEHSFQAGLTNCSTGEISGRLNLKNNVVTMNLNANKIKIFCADGTIRYYERFKIQSLLTIELCGMKQSLDSFLFHLKQEILPSQNKIIYEYNNDSTLSGIRTTNLNESKTYSVLNIQHLNNRIILTSSDEKKLVQDFKEEKKNAFITFTQFPERPDEAYGYCFDEKLKPCISQKNKPRGRDFHIEYYTRGKHAVNGRTILVGNVDDPKLMRVKSIKSRVGQNGELIETHKFIYNINPDHRSGFTEVYGADNIKTIYRFSNLRLDAIERYDETNKLRNREILIWGKGQNATKDVTFLLSKTFLDSENSIVFHKEFIYDNRGNITKENFFGSISGKNKEVLYNPNISFEAFIGKAKDGLELFSTCKTYSSDKNLLLSEENDNQLRIEYSYLANTDLIKSKVIKHKNKIKIRNFYEYNEDFVLIKEITDDGSSYDMGDLSNVTQRHIKAISPKKEAPFINMPHIIEEKYLDLKDRQEKLIKKCVFTYSNHGKVIKEEIYDSKNIKAYTAEKQYDDRGNLIKEINAEGYVTVNGYDENFNLITKREPNGKAVNFEYDPVNRLIKKDEIASDNVHHISSFSYDLKSNVLFATDYLKNTTCFKYDCFNNLIETQKPKSAGFAVISSKYDDISRKIETKDPNGNITKTCYNAHNSPVKIIYPDNTREEFIYNLDGTLKTHIDQQNTFTTYEYDFLQRDIKKTVLSSDQKNHVEESINYDSFNIRSHKDFEGNTIFYEYDGAGRKILQKSENEKTGFLYDNLSRLTTTVFLDEGNTLFNIEIKDFLNRTTEERKEDGAGKIYYKIQYEYDSQNNKTKITRYIQNSPCFEKFTYDSFNRLIRHEDALGNADFASYLEQNNCLQTVHMDPVNLQTIKMYDSLNRVVKEEKIKDGVLLSGEEFSYDPADNLICQKSTVINQEDKSHKIVEIKKEYDEMNRVKTLMEAANSKTLKITYYSYTKKGEIFQITKPNKVVLTYEYDYLNLNTRLFSSDNGFVKPIDYQFKYNNLGHVVQAKDNISNLTINRKLDHKNRILSEIFSKNLKIENVYDDRGNKIKLVLPDKSYVEYVYNSCYLERILRKDSKGLLIYHYEADQYDLDGNLLTQTLINKTQMLNQYNKIGRNVKIQTGFFTQAIDSLNPDGTIRQMSFMADDQKDSSFYSYDGLKQLTKETGFFNKNYGYDSHNNRLKKDNDDYEISDLNQILKTSLDELTYDANGNPIRKISADGEIFYKYDALDRLAYVEKTNDYKLEFEYDAFHRRLLKKYTKYNEDRFSSDGQEISEDHYLYDSQNEIGCLDSQNNFKELRILSNTVSAEIGSSIAFEINNNIYLPIHDLQGNVAFIISPADAESYRYSAFGEEKIFFNKQPLSASKFNNNWRFSSKRKDESNLIYYGRRYYDSGYGRWLTPDPEGFNNGINLYAFVLNDPLIRVDLYGLYANPYMFDGLFNNCERDKSQILPTLGDPYSTNKIFVINGQNNTKSSALENAQFLYNNLKTISNKISITPIYASTRGLVHDTIRSVLQKSNLYLPRRIEMIRNTLSSHANELIEKNVNTKSFIVSFSRGSMDLDCALKGLKAEQKSKFIIYNLGFSKAIANENGFLVQNIRSSSDKVPSFVAPFSCCGVERNINSGFIEGNIYNGFKTTDKYNITKIESEEGHRFKNTVYQNYLYNSFENYFKKEGFR